MKDVLKIPVTYQITFYNQLPTIQVSIFAPDNEVIDILFPKSEDGENDWAALDTYFQSIENNAQIDQILAYELERYKKYVNKELPDDEMEFLNKKYHEIGFSA